jgi:hypothetical protein
MKKPTQQQTWVGLIMALLTAATSYLGYEKYEISQAKSPDITMNITTPTTEHAHRSTENIQAIIDKTIEAHRQRDH